MKSLQENHYFVPKAVFFIQDRSTVAEGQWALTKVDELYFHERTLIKLARIIKTFLFYRFQTVYTNRIFDDDCGLTFSTVVCRKLTTFYPLCVYLLQPHLQAVKTFLRDQTVPDSCSQRRVFKNFRPANRSLNKQEK